MENQQKRLPKLNMPDESDAAVVSTSDKEYSPPGTPPTTPQSPAPQLIEKPNLYDLITSASDSEMGRLFTNMLKQKAEGKTATYNKIIYAFKTEPSYISTDLLRRWISGFSSIVSHLKPFYSDLVMSILEVNWASKDNRFFLSFRQFVEYLVSAHAVYIQPVVKMLVPHFLPGQLSEKLEDIMLVFDRTHQILRSVLGLIPIGPQFLMENLKDNFPYKTEPIYVQVWYLKNILQLDQYAPVYRESILALVIERLIQIDVDIQGEIEDLDEEVFEEVEKLDLEGKEVVVNTEAGVLFRLDEDGADLISESGYASSDEGSDDLPVTAIDVRGMIDKIDAMMQIVLNYLTEFGKLYQSKTQKEREVVEDLFTSLLTIFQKSVLQTHRSRYTQFIWFYFCSFDSRFAEQFMALLVSLLFDGQTPPLIRVSAAAYIGSFAARGKFLGTSVVRQCLRYLNGWALAYVNDNEDALQRLTSGDLQHFKVFYNVVQSMMYIFCFRWKELVQEEDDQFNRARYNYSKLPSEMNGFQRIITSRFAPLKVCAEGIVSEFAELMHKLEIDYVYSLMESENRYTPGKVTDTNTKITSSNEFTMIEPLDTFFPFDPMTLSKRSIVFIERIYQEWDGGDDENDVEDVVGSFTMQYGDDNFSAQVGSLSSAASTRDSTTSTKSGQYVFGSIPRSIDSRDSSNVSGRFAFRIKKDFGDDDSDEDFDKRMELDFGKSPDFGRSPMDYSVMMSL